MSPDEAMVDKIKARSKHISAATASSPGRLPGHTLRNLDASYPWSWWSGRAVGYAEVHYKGDTLSITKEAGNDEEDDQQQMAGSSKAEQTRGAWRRRWGPTRSAGVDAADHNRHSRHAAHTPQLSSRTPMRVAPLDGDDDGDGDYGDNSNSDDAGLER